MSHERDQPPQRDHTIPSAELELESLPMFQPLDTSSLTRRSTADIILSDKRVSAYLLSPKTWLARLVCLIVWVVAVCGLAAACWWLVPLVLKDVVNPVQQKIKRDWNPMAVAFLVLGGVSVVPIVLLPAGPFIWLAAVSLGVVKGYLVVQLGTALGMTASYLLGKRFLRQRIRRWVEQKDWAQALFAAVKEAGPFKVVLLMRLGPAPYAWLSYACSLSPDIRYRQYIGASVLGRSPHNLLDIYIGSGVMTAGDAALGEKLDPVLITSYVVGFVLAVGICGWGYLYAKRALRDLRARAVARDQVLATFSFPELDDFDLTDSPDLRSRAEKGDRSTGSGAVLELLGVEDATEHSSRDEESAAQPSQSGRSGSGSKVVRGMRGERTRVVADCSAPSDESRRLVDENQTRSDQE